MKRKSLVPINTNWLRYIIITSVIVISALVGVPIIRSMRSDSSMIPTWLLLFMGALGAGFIALLALRNMTVALTLLVATSSLITVSISTGTNSPVNLTILMVVFLLGVWVLRMVVIERKIKFVPSPMNGPMILFLIAICISWFASYILGDWGAAIPSNAFQVQAGQFAMFALSFAAFFLVGNHRLSKDTLVKWNWIIIILGILAIGSDILRVYPNPLPGVKGAMQMWPFVLIFGQLLFNPNLKRNYRIFGWLALIMWGYWAFLTPTVYTKGLWVPAFIAMGLLLAIRKFGFTILLGMLSLIALLSSGYLRNLIVGELATGSSFRPLIWQDIINMTSHNPLLGLGPANYFYYWRILGNKSLTALSIYQARGDLLGFQKIAISSHNLFVDVYAQTGIIGLVFFVLVILLAVRFGWHLVQKLSPGFYQAHVYGVVAGFIAMALGSFWFADWLIPFVYNITINGFRHSVYTWLLLGTLVSINYFNLKDFDHGKSG